MEKKNLVEVLYGRITQTRGTAKLASQSKHLYVHRYMYSARGTTGIDGYKIN